MGPPPLPDHETAPPAPPTDHLADRVFDPAAMDRARAVLRQEHGGAQVSQVMANLLEYRAQAGGNGYHWDGEAWFGGDLNRLVIKSEGEGGRHGVQASEVQALYSRPVALYTDLQVGLRQDVEPKSRTYAAVGFETLLPYWIEAGGAVFVPASHQGLPVMSKKTFKADRIGAVDLFFRVVHSNTPFVK